MNSRRGELETVKADDYFGDTLLIHNLEPMTWIEAFVGRDWFTDCILNGCHDRFTFRGISNFDLAENQVMSEPFLAIVLWLARKFLVAKVDCVERQRA